MDDTTNIVTDGTMEWLQWDLTQGLSINQALTNYSSNGWALASNAQMSNLYNVFGFGVPIFDNTENGLQERNNKANSLYTQFVELFGAVSVFIDQCATTSQIFCLSSPNAAGTSALYGSDDDLDGNYKVALVSIAGSGQSFDPTGKVSR